MGTTMPVYPWSLLAGHGSVVSGAGRNFREQLSGFAVSCSTDTAVGACPTTCTQHALSRNTAMTAALGACPGSIGACWTERGGPFSTTSLRLVYRQRQQSRPERAIQRCRVCAAAFRPCIDIHQAGFPSHAAYSLQKGLCRKPESMHALYAYSCQQKAKRQVNAPCMRIAGSCEADCWFFAEGPSQAEARIYIGRSCSLKLVLLLRTPSCTLLFQRISGEDTHAHVASCMMQG